MIRVESKGSIWLIDTDLNRYMRMPRIERPRERPEWGGPDAGALQDFTWHPFDDWCITPGGQLRISLEDGRVATAPYAEVIVSS